MLFGLLGPAWEAGRLEQTLLELYHGRCAVSAGLCSPNDGTFVVNEAGPSVLESWGLTSSNHFKTDIASFSRTG